MDILWPTDFESRHIFELRGEQKAWRDLYNNAYFESSQMLDFVELKQNGLDNMDREDYSGANHDAADSPTVCEVSYLPGHPVVKRAG